MPQLMMLPVLIMVPRMPMTPEQEIARTCAELMTLQFTNSVHLWLLEHAAASKAAMNRGLRTLQLTPGGAIHTPRRKK